MRTISFKAHYFVQSSLQPIVYQHKIRSALRFHISEPLLTICGSFDRLTQPEISFSVSRFTVLMLRISGCFVTISPATRTKKKEKKIVKKIGFSCEDGKKRFHSTDRWFCDNKKKKDLTRTRTQQMQTIQRTGFPSVNICSVKFGRHN